MKQKEIELLKLLEKNGRLETETISKMLNMPPKEIEELITKLENEQKILGYSTLIDWSSVYEYEGVAALIDVKVTPVRGVGFDKIASRIYRFPEVKAVYLMSGSYDLSVSVEGKTMMEVSRFVSDKLSTLDTVVSTTTHFILKKYKHDGIIFDDESDDDKRIMVTP
ncbi:DNA-binding Lrp family transcriptional regulator [Gracilibacillus halotolerans]|uniref:DNA-binding Lrp family transcriptional regulator n=1 Tax=Gracilibacillus halotolerans TaxID=74386 RepID=A0A841RKT8_9BACI|nr:Lrp/AsnC family transcriptional regulator [Gracilibacillus halotolerans]MBB6512487.1 DNA-binding Lrp family transcriptional regulator [Gracilibacillus halotolerans]